MKLNYKRMVKDIDRLDNNYVCFDLELKLMPDSKEISPEDAKEAIRIIGQVYMISHGITCSNCNKKYLIK